MPEEDNGTTPEQELIEQLADKEHASWARWMRYLFNVCEAYFIVDPDGFTRYEGVLIPPELVQEIVKEAIAQKQQELAIIQMVKRSRND